MLAVDTNVLLRHIVKDNKKQTEAAQSFIEKLTPQQPGFICREVALEIAWVLESVYEFPRTRIADFILDLTATEEMVVESGEDVATAARRFRTSNDDFSDLMILAAAQRVGANPLYTFDQRLARMEGAALLTVPQPG